MNNIFISSAKKDEVIENFVKSKREELEKMIPGFVDDRKITDIVLNFYERGIRDGVQMMLDRMTENVVDGICISNGAECGSSLGSAFVRFCENKAGLLLSSLLFCLLLCIANPTLSTREYVGYSLIYGFFVGLISNVERVMRERDKKKAGETTN